MENCICIFVFYVCHFQVSSVPALQQCDSRCTGKFHNICCYEVTLLKFITSSKALFPCLSNVYYYKEIYQHIFLIGWKQGHVPRNRELVVAVK